MTKKVHFIGVGGIGMSALARICLGRGHVVSGSDKKPSALLEELAAEGVALDFEQKGRHVSADMTVVYSSDIGAENPELLRAKEVNARLFHRSDLLGELTLSKRTLLVTGTHGKTTTTSLLAHVLETAQKQPSYAIGGIPLSLGRNGKEGKGADFVVEADESDGSFLRYSGFGGIVTNIGLDHLSHWKTEEALIEGFAQFTKRLSSPEHLFWCSDDERLSALHLPGISYGFGAGAKLRLLSFVQEGWKSIFSFTFRGTLYEGIELPLIGRYNALNAAAVFGLCLELGLSEQEIRKGLQSFQGVKRRCEQKGEKQGITLIDDYAHHPTEIAATLASIKKGAGGRRVVALFQPHRYSRVSTCWDDFKGAFSSCDLLLVTDIYSAGETPIEGCTATRLAGEMEALHIPRGELCEKVTEKVMPHDIIVTLGAGDITHFAAELLSYWETVPPKKLRVALLFGGMSSEHEVSLLSCRNIYNSLRPDLYDVRPFWIDKRGGWHSGPAVFAKAEEGYLPSEGEKIDRSALLELSDCDVAFPVFHGQFGEDGAAQGLFELFSLPYVGCDHRASALVMDKGLSKRIVETYGVSVAPYVECERAQWEKDSEAVLCRVEEELSYPLFAKPSHLGSSVEVWRVTTREELKTAIRRIFAIDFRLVIEEEILGREMEFAVLGNTSPLVMHPCEILKGEQFFSYEKKYGSAPMPIDLACSIPPQILAEGKKIVLKTYLALGARGLSRVDFFLTPEGEWVFNELNPLPGCTANSRYPKICRAAGISDQELISSLIIYALERERVEVEPLRAHPLQFSPMRTR